MSDSKNSTVHKTNMIPALTECLRLNCSEIHVGINQWVLRQEFIWLKMTIIIIPLVWKLIFQKDTSRASSSLHVHLVPLYCYYQVNVFFPSTNLTLFESSIIKLSHLVHPSFAFKKPPFQSFQRYSFQFTFLPTSTANSTRVTHPVFRPLASSNCFTIIHLWYPFLRAPR